MPDQVPQRKKNAYVKRMYKVQQGVVKQLAEEDIGKTYKCIIDNVDRSEEHTSELQSQR